MGKKTKTKQSVKKAASKKAASKKTEPKKSLDATKTCPYCAEAIRVDAVKCRYCHSFLGPRLPAGEPADRVTYVLDRGLIRFVKFTLGILVVFSVVGLFLFGLDLQAIRKGVTSDRDSVHAALADIESLKKRVASAAALAQEHSLAAAEHSASGERIFERARKMLGAIAQTLESSEELHRKLTQEQEARLAARQDSDPEVFERQNLWPVGHTLSVRFLEGDAEQIALVRRQAKKWQEVANLNFEFVESGPADIRIAFRDDQGVWSYRSTDSLAIAESEPTMNLGLFDPDGGNVLLAFGTVLGLLKEHQNPLRTFEWDEEVVRIEAGQRGYWNESDIQQRILATWPMDALPIAKDYDEDSIMHDQFDASWFMDKKARGGKSVLSDKDKEFAGQLYPRD